MGAFHGPHRSIWLIHPQESEPSTNFRNATLVLGDTEDTQSDIRVSAPTSARISNPAEQTPRSIFVGVTDAELDAALLEDDNTPQPSRTLSQTQPRKRADHVLTRIRSAL